MAYPVPEYIASKHDRGAHGFRMKKREQLKQLKAVLRDFSNASACFPCGMDPLIEIDKQVDRLSKSLSVEIWGR